jgi:hypothetical protein
MFRISDAAHRLVLNAVNVPALQEIVITQTLQGGTGPAEAGRHGPDRVRERKTDN